MHYVFLLVLCLLVFIDSGLAQGSASTSATTAIVYVYTMNHEVCHDMHEKQTQRWNTFPTYVRETLNQALFTQQNSKDAQVVFISNYKNCANIQKKIIDAIDPNMRTRLLNVDVADIQSTRTTNFINSSENILSATHGNLWIASSTRFFYIEDFLLKYNSFKDIIHLEADNLLYSPLVPLLPSLRKNYKDTIVATPMDANKSGITASFVWISNKEALRRFTDYFINLTNIESDDWLTYAGWLRRYACCKDHSGIAEDENGRGLKPFKVNEMTILANFRRLYPDYLQTFPILPRFEYYRNRYTVNGSFFAPGGEEVGLSLYELEPQVKVLEDQKHLPLITNNDAGWQDRVAIPNEFGSLFDPGSWGQYLGGTNLKRGSNKGFSDSSHIIGQAVTTNHCVAEMRCGNINGLHYMHDDNNNSGKKCYQAPFVRCGSMEEYNGTKMTPWHPLIHLHVHSKNINKFLSKTKQCSCHSIGELKEKI